MTIKNYYVEIHGDPTLFPAVISDRPLTAYYDEASPGGRIGGIFVPNKTYLGKVAEICKAHDILLIIDEIQNIFKQGVLTDGEGRMGLGY